jgi:hypothetical protein
MTTPITEKQPHQQVPAAAIREWCCGTPITGPHADGCAYAPEPDMSGHAVAAPETVPEPPPAPSPAPAAAPRRGYGFTKAGEHDLDLPSGDRVRYRKLSKSYLLKLNLIEVMDGFTPELLAEVNSGDEDVARDAALKALTDPQRNGKIFGPVDRVVAAAVVIPTVVLEGPTTDEQVNVDDIDLEDKLTIFDAAIGEQLAALKSVRGQSTADL